MFALLLVGQASYPIWANDCHIANLVIINWLVGAGLSISRWASEIAGKPAPTKCDIRKTNWYDLSRLCKLNAQSLSPSS